MLKWVDYFVTNVKYNVDENRIGILEVRSDIEEDEDFWPREKVVEQIEKFNKTFCRVNKSNMGVWQKNSKINLVDINGEKFLRTDKNKICRDNLEKIEI